MIAFTTVLAAVWLTREANPEERFRAITGRNLPAGVDAIAYDWEYTDNLFHKTHYWLLNCSHSALRSMTDRTGFTESLEDARGALPDMQRLFGVPLAPEDVIEGYEWERDRDRWFCIFSDGETAFYAH